MNKSSKTLHSFKELESILPNEISPPKGSVEELKKELIAYVHAHALCFKDTDKMIHYINNDVTRKSSLKRLKKQLEDKVNKTDKKKLGKMETMRNEMFEIIAENNLHVGEEMLRKIATSNATRELKYLFYQIKEKYKLCMEDIERTHKSLYAILTPMGNQIR